MVPHARFDNFMVLGSLAGEKSTTRGCEGNVSRERAQHVVSGVDEGRECLPLFSCMWRARVTICLSVYQHQADTQNEKGYFINRVFCWMEN